MKTYEILTSEFGESIKRIDPDGAIWFIPTDPANSDYAEYLRYTAWVEAGNTPEEFWTQTDDFLDTSFSEVSQPKEEETTEQPSSTETKIETDLGE